MAGKKRTLTALLLCLAVIFFYIGCGSESNSNLKNKFDESHKMKICLITMDGVTPYWEEIDEGCRQAVSESGIVNYEWLAPSERDPVHQIECIDRAVADKVNAILISPVSDSGVNDSLKDAENVGIKIIYVDSTAENIGAAVLMTDNEIAGQTAGETMLRAFREAGITSGTVGVMANTPDTFNTSLRDRGFRRAFEYTAFTVAPTIYANGNPLSITESVIEHSDYVGFFGSNQTSTLRIGEQIKNSGSKQIVVGFDTAGETLDLIENGVIYATLKQNAYKMGHDGIEIAIKAVLGEHDSNNFNIDTGVEVITKENVGQLKK